MKFGSSLTLIVRVQEKRAKISTRKIFARFCECPAIIFEGEGSETAMTDNLALHNQKIAVTRFAFDNGEAEHLVTRLRQHLTDAAQLQVAGSSHEAHRHQERAQAIYDDIENRLILRFERYARGYFPDEPQTQEDAIREMVCQLYATLFGEPDKSLYFTQKFNHAVKRLIINAIRIVRKENGRDRDTGKPNLATVSMDSLQVNSSTEDESGSLKREVADPNSYAAVNRILGKDLAQYFLARLPSQKHRDIYRLEVEEFSWKEIAQTVGLPVRTAQHYHSQSKAVLRKVVQRYNEETTS